MDIPRPYPPSLLNESEHLTALSKLRGSKGSGAPAARNAVMMRKTLILQQLYNLSDEQVEFQVTDRLSFTR
jgi:IS5 family transposase